MKYLTHEYNYALEMNCTRALQKMNFVLKSRPNYTSYKILYTLLLYMRLLNNTIAVLALRFIQKMLMLPFSHQQILNFEILKYHNYIWPYFQIHETIYTNR